MLLAAAPFDGKGLVQLRWSDDDRKIVNFSVVMCWPLWTPMDPAHTLPTQLEVDGVSGVSWGRGGCPWSAAFALTCCVGALPLMTAEDRSWWRAFLVDCGVFLPQRTA
jgi:hypothetical protein